MIFAKYEQHMAHQDQRWERVLARFAALENELQELYWEVLECMDDVTTPTSH
jgi:hypothetical protein